MRSLLQASHELLIHDPLIGRPAWIDVIFPCVDSFPLSFIVVPSSPVQRFAIDAVRSGAYADRDKEAKVPSSVNITRVRINTLP